MMLKRIVGYSSFFQQPFQNEQILTFFMMLPHYFLTDIFCDP